VKELSDFSRIIGEMPFEALVAVVLLAGFALAAYAIYAVVLVTKGPR
jgi:hypothetical protein